MKISYIFKSIFTFSGILLMSMAAKAGLESADSSSNTPTPEIRYDLNKDGTAFVKVNLLNQTWLRFNQSNPGTLLNGEPTPNTFDIGLRRTRMQVSAKIYPRVLLYMQFGMNNFSNQASTFGNRKVQTFFHDALGQFSLIEGSNYLDMGAGLTIMNGLSRFSQPGVTSIMSLDVPVFAQATVDQTDQFSRKLSVYADGQAGPLHYRLVLSDPFPITTNGSGAPVINKNATFVAKGQAFQYQGYFAYNFFDHEKSLAPGYMAGTYLGKKKVFNIEAGAIYQPTATATSSGTDTSYHNMLLYSVALFADMPLNKEKGSAINAYLGYFNTNYGPGYLRLNGLMNPAPAISPGYTGQGGNSYPMFGTGQVIYGQLGYLLPEGKIMPYATAQYAIYGRLNDNMLVWDLGVNYFYRGHNCKFTLDYQDRPVYSGDGFDQAGRKGCLIFQFQAYI